MAPKVTCNAQKLTSIQSWFRKSRTVWSLKELEKQLPSVGSINGMQVRDYVQSLQDDNRISVEKIGSGNWYWAFPSQHAKNVEAAHSAIQTEHERISGMVNEFKSRLDARAAETQAETDDIAEEAESRDSLTARCQALQGEVQLMGKELEAYSGDDLTELEKLKQEAWTDFALADLWTEDIYALEGWFKKQGAEELVRSFPETVYGSEWHEDEEQLRELVWQDVQF